ncbi:hypothetical protein Hanom_Chr17g01588471 [Helianthus anomalus]
MKPTSDNSYFVINIMTSFIFENLVENILVSSCLENIYQVLGFSENFAIVSFVNRGVHAKLAYHFLLYISNSSFSIIKPTYRQTKHYLLYFSFTTQNRSVYEDFYKIVNLF